MTFEPIPGVTVIGLGHKARHGKDTAAAAIIAEYPGAMRFSFADDLYAIARVHHGMTTKDAPLLQQIGADYRQCRGQDIWVRSVYAKILDAQPKVAVLTDVRHQSEFDFVKKLGGVTVELMRFNEDGSGFVDPSRPADHVSETELDKAPWDYYITAMDGDIEGVRRGARIIAGFLLNNQVKAA